MWDIVGERCLETMSGHSEGVVAVTATSDYSAVVSGSIDKTLAVWSVAGASQASETSTAAGVLHPSSEDNLMGQPQASSVTCLARLTRWFNERVSTRSGGPRHR